MSGNSYEKKRKYKKRNYIAKELRENRLFSQKKIDKPKTKRLSKKDILREVSNEYGRRKQQRE